MSNDFQIKTPHAAVIVWNYSDRVGVEGVKDLNSVEETIISTLSCVSIQTAKAKGNPAGSFQLVLAPFKNWVSTITAGSWCCILMSNKKINPADLKKANPDLVKMIGKIETVRVETQQDKDQRQTRYIVSGTDWGHIFNNTLYVDNLLASANDPATQGNAAAVALRNALFGNGNAPSSFAVKDNLRSLVNIFGSNLKGFSEKGDDINRLAKATYDFIMPKEMVDFFGFVDAKKAKNKALGINNILKIQTGKLIGPDKYDETPESFGYIDPFSLQGTNSFWQVLMDNSNPAINEMYNEIEWTKNGPSLTLFNRIKPFAYRQSTDVPAQVKNLRSLFQYVKTHKIDSVQVTSVNAGTNWRDKYNFIEIKPNFQDFNIIANWTKQKTQISDEKAFNREGFRPLIIATKQFPVRLGQGTTVFNPDMLRAWALLMKEWYFDTHRLLNGTITMTGSTEYIGVGNNIMFDAGLINPTPNINKAANKNKKNPQVLAHVENISHSFTVDQEGAREYVTTIQFVRGILITDNGSLSGSGKLDTFSNDLIPAEDRNKTNTVSTTNLDSDDPDPQKVRGT